MNSKLRLKVIVLLNCLLAETAAAQQQGLAPQDMQQPPPVQAAAPQQAPVQVPAGFALNALQQAELDQVLIAWQQQSAKVNTFKCDFERWEYNLVFGPSPDIALNKNKGELSFGRPDKGSFRITEINTWTQTPQPPGQPAPAVKTGTWVPQPNAIGEHWVCDGESVFEYRHNQKQLVQRRIPPHLQGQAIVDGPLPFLFGADANKLKARYWMRVEQQPNQAQVWLVALPKFQAQAADFRAVEVILDRQRLLPTHMQVHLPNGDRHMYTFNIAGATINSPLQKLQVFFQLPRLPVGWKRIVEQMPVEQAAQPAPAPR
ncbi:MAG TPA: TIGR03009 domain-containing protein [Lacipirellulaceae bacterium]|jgi:TIGR03009 family protein|nr:TIGR03009 domain-containing protein [Lacipirellulaceae bacterium]